MRQTTSALAPRYQQATKSVNRRARARETHARARPLSNSLRSNSKHNVLKKRSSRRA